MRKKINLYLIEYAINAILRQSYKNFFIVTVFTILTFLLTSVFFITNSLRYEMDSTVDTLPQIIVQKMKAGRHYDIDVNRVDKILEIPGVSDAVARVWGYYYFENAGVNFSVVGIEQYENQYKNSFVNLVKKFDFDKLKENSSMLVGAGVKRTMENSYYKEYFNFIKPNGTLKKVTLGGVFDGDTNLESNDMIIMPQEIVREIFDLDPSKATDIVVKVANPMEIQTVASKIKLMFPDTRIITTGDLKVSYQNIFDYKSGIFLIIIYDKASGVTSEEKREIGILKAIGWTVDDVLKEKFYESFVISLFSYGLGVGLSLAYVYLFQAPLLRDIFVGYSQLKTNFELPFVFDMQTLFLVFLLSVPIYIAATIIPSWKVATLEADEVIR
jgi:ABC-type lipoprotein release transport system permease subunit